MKEDFNMKYNRLEGYLHAMDNGKNPRIKGKEDGYVKPWNFPSELIVHFDRGDISPRELVLLGVINSHTNTRPDGTISKCYASNRYLAKKSHLSPSQTRTVLYQLIKKGIVIRTEKEKENGKKQRYLRPFWRVKAKTPHD